MRHDSRPFPVLLTTLFMVVAGPTARSAQLPETRAAEGRPEAGRVAILNEPDMPMVGAGSSPQTIARILEAAGFATRLLSADELADASVLNTSAFDILVLSSGQSFPSHARASVVAFLHGGGDLITTGGYAFNHLWRKDAGRWQSEPERLKAALEQATTIERSLLANGDFEAAQSLPDPGQAIAGQWQRSTAERCTIVDEKPQEGRSCAQVRVTPGIPDLAPVFFQDVPAKPGTVYRVSGWIKAEQVIPSGMAFIAIYQYDANGKLVTFRDFAVARGTSDWTYYSFVFTAEPAAARLHVKFGLYETHGTAWFDDLRLNDITGTQAEPMNTSTGKPMDGLLVKPEQIGMFDASFPLKRACRIATAPGQHVIHEPIDVRHDLAGWAASGIVGYDNARWVPLLQTYDRYARPRGAAGAMLINYAGYYAGSCWAYLGIENLDLFRESDGAMAGALQRIARFLLRQTFLRNLTTDHRLYRGGELANVSVFVDNRAQQPRNVSVRFTIGPTASSDVTAEVSKQITLAPRTAQRVDAQFDKFDPAIDLYRVTATLLADGEPIDELTTGFVVDRPDVLHAGLPLRFRDNYFTLNDRPVFLFGSDTWVDNYKSVYENPLTWSADHLAARDVGLNIYENLQYNNPGHQMSDDDWRSFRAMAQLTQKHHLVFMPGMLIGHNVAIGDEMLAEQSALCRGYVEHLGDTPGLLYYINGDYQMQLDEHRDDVKTLWNRWLTDKYQTTERLRAAWGANAVTAELGQLDSWPPNTGRWDDVAIVDRLRFQTWLTRRWNEAHVAALRKGDTLHPITSEYYQMCWAGMDLRLTIDGQDVANIGFFDQPVVDLDILPLKVRFNDLRARGKGVSFGEYGVKTHPAWSVENGAEFYHIRRTEQEQAQLFLAVAHYGLGMGLSKIQNWCLRDSQGSVFPWGIFYPNQLIPKDVAYVHRNQSIIWRHFTPRYVPPALTVCVPNNLRLGNYEAIGRTVADNAFETLLDLHYDFNVVDDHDLEHLPPETKVLVYPSPLAVDDDAYQRLLAWVRQGGQLLVTGDFSYDADRQRTRTQRLVELAGVEFVGENYPSIHRIAPSGEKAAFSLDGAAPLPAGPCIRVKPTTAEVLGKTADGGAVFVRHRVGNGQVFFFTDPTELAADEQARQARQAVYGAFLRAAGVRGLEVRPDAPWLHVMAQPTARGTVHVVFNRKKSDGQEPVRIPTAAGELSLSVRNRYPALAAVTTDGKVVAVNACGTAGIGEQPLLTGQGMKAMLSLDGLDLRSSRSVLVAPFETGVLELPVRDHQRVAIVGEYRDGHWTTLERLPIEPAGGPLAIDADRATCLILLCEPANETKWTDQLTNAMMHPDLIAGY